MSEFFFQSYIVKDHLPACESAIATGSKFGVSPRTGGAFGEIIGQSGALRQIIKQIEMVAPTNASVLILGETGTGKEVIARELHWRSYRKHMPLVRVNCACIPKELYESEFFGHARGAFTGAIKDRVGRFESAAGGTLFLDEIGEIPPVNCPSFDPASFLLKPAIFKGGDQVEPEFVTEAEIRRRERENVFAALQKTNWKIKGADGAADLLGLKPTTLISRIEKMGLKRTGSIAR